MKNKKKETQKPKTGRPKTLKDLERISISLSKKEKEILLALAKKENLSISEFIRNLIKVNNF